ncbi:zinc finger MYM-type protein 1 isoform X5 [Rhopalosiphum padi]|uniref:zinc finger MYM-type protein 1 isoform X5 n=1 Tax=Rhopalosiphum padi TaxID=40932 RepID=UPI00298D8539|nr:zinc finger MYM-type protein 1 isoform X5 [Rhopalosiphum padi]
MKLKDDGAQMDHHLNMMLELVERLERNRWSAGSGGRRWRPDARPPLMPLQAELRTLELWRSVMAECLATFLYVAVVCGAATSDASPVLGAAAASGFTMLALTVCLQNVSDYTRIFNMEAKKKLSGSGYRKQAKIKKLKHDALIKNCRKLDSMFKPSNNSNTDDKLEMLNQGTQIQMNPDYSNVNSSEQYKPTKSSGYIETENTDDELDMLNQDTQIQMNPDYSNINSSEQHNPMTSSGNIVTENTDDKLEMLNQDTQIQIYPDYSNVNSSEQHKLTKSSGYIKTENSISEINTDILSSKNNETADVLFEPTDIPRCDPALWKINEFTIEYICINGFSQDLNDLNFTKSKRAYTKLHKKTTKTYYRFCNKNYWNTRLTNGDSIKRNFIAYSESKGVIYCIPCLLFGNINSSSFASKGFSNWKRAEELISQHENSLKHRSNILAMKNRGQTHQRIDQQIIQQIENERMYWINVLKRVVAIVKTLASRGLAFRGHTSKIGCPRNGNFMMALELLAEFDPFISNHISKNGNPGKGHTSYLSYYIYEQFILLMSKKVENTIIQDVNTSRYFSISVDSTPDITHTDQLSLVVRFVDESGNVFERFLCFMNNVGHKSEDIAEAVITILNKYNLNLNYLRGQSYDNASNMSGSYSGLQARIKLINPLAKFVPCSAHSLNLVGQNAASCCNEAIHFFNFLQNLYTFFSASTYRWQILNSSIKRLSDTRWSARDDACYSLNKNWSSIENALIKIGENEKEKPAIRCEANDKDYENFKRNAIEKCGIMNFRNTGKRQKKIKKFSDDSSMESIVTNFKINTYFVILDQLKSELLRRKIAYDNLLKNYYFFFKITKMTAADIRVSAELLRNEYNTDLGTSFPNECIHFSSYLKTISNPPQSIQDMLVFIRKNNLKDIFPYIDIALRMLLCTPVSNCSTERSFSALKRIKSYLRSNIGEERLTALAIMNIESDVTTAISYDDIIQEFAQDHARRKV